MKKKISQIILYSVLGVVVLAFILCSVLKISFKPEMKVPTSSTVGKIQISTTDGTARVESSNENIGVEKFNSKFNSAFELSVLYSLFSGRMNNEVKREKLTELPARVGYEVLFIYNEQQVLKVNGEEVMEADNSVNPIKYNRVVFSVENEKGLAETSLYFYTNGTKGYYKLTTIANFDGLYDYISDMSMFGE